MSPARGSARRSRLEMFPEDDCGRLFRPNIPEGNSIVSFCSDTSDESFIRTTVLLRDSGICSCTLALKKEPCVSQSELSVTSSALDGLHYISHAGVTHQTRPTPSCSPPLDLYLHFIKGQLTNNVDVFLVFR